MNLVKKIILFFFLVVLFFTIKTYAATVGSVNVSATRLRKEASTDSDIITNIYQEEEVEILGESGEWYQVKYNGNTGYVKKDYITLSEIEVEIPSTTTNTTSNEVTQETTTSSEESSTTAETTSTTVITNASTNLRYLPVISSNVISAVEANKEFTKLNEASNWIQVTDGTLTGWIPKTKVGESTTSVDVSSTSSTDNTNTATNTATNTTTNTATNTTTTNTAASTTTTSNVGKTGTVNVETANVRESASSTAEIIGFLDYNDEITITEEDGDWYKFTSDDVSGYVSKKLITISSDTVSSRSLTEERSASTYESKDTTTVSDEANDSLTATLSSATTESTGSQVVAYASQFLGYPYVSGGKTPDTGFDCSGFTKYVFSNFGYTLGNSASSQASVGTEISKDSLEPGDLLIFYNESKTAIGHTGIYVGDGEFIHAANAQRGVVTDNLNTSTYYNERFVSARRVV